MTTRAPRAGRCPWQTVQPATANSEEVTTGPGAADSGRSPHIQGRLLSWLPGTTTSSTPRADSQSLRRKTSAAVRGQGHGRSLVLSALKWARLRGARQAWLQVEAANQPALALYRSLGFEEVYPYHYRRPPGAAIHG